MSSIILTWLRDAIIVLEHSDALLKKAFFGRIATGVSEPFGILDRSLALSILFLILVTMWVLITPDVFAGKELFLICVYIYNIIYSNKS